METPVLGDKLPGNRKPPFFLDDFIGNPHILRDDALGQPRFWGRITWNYRKELLQDWGHFCRIRRVKRTFNLLRIQFRSSRNCTVVRGIHQVVFFSSSHENYFLVLVTSGHENKHQKGRLLPVALLACPRG